MVVMQHTPMQPLVTFSFARPRLSYRLLHFPLCINMFRRRFSKVPSLRFLGVEVNSSLLRPRHLFSSFNPSFTRNLATNTTNRLPSRRLSNILDPKSLMMDLDGEIFNYTTGRFLCVSYILSRLFLTNVATCSVPTKPITSHSADASSTSQDSSKSSLRQQTARRSRSPAFESSEKVASTVSFSSP